MKQRVLASLMVILTFGCDRSFDFNLTPQVDSFSKVISYNNKLDIVWVIDDSASMEKYQRDLVTESEAYIANLNQMGWDYRLIVVSTDYAATAPESRAVGEPLFLTKNSAGLLQEFQARLLRGERGSNREMGLQSVSDLITFQGDLLLRSDAFLVINILSDEEDASFVSVPDLVEQLNETKALAKDFPSGWIANFIGVTSDVGRCRTYDSHASVGTRYNELVAVSSGMSDNICDRNFRRALNGFQTVITEILTDYRLDRLPEISTIKVYVNNQLLPQDSINGWTYHAEGNFVRFHGTAVPSAEVSVWVDYVPVAPK